VDLTFCHLSTGESDLFLGYREPDLGDSSLSVVLDTLVPNYRKNKSLIPLPVYQGSLFIGKKRCGGEAITSEMCEEGSGKEYAWLRGLGIKLSSVKTRSDRKKEEDEFSFLSVIVSSSTDFGELRAMKSLAREK
jgi:hypothetical protein